MGGFSHGVELVSNFELQPRLWVNDSQTSHQGLRPGPRPGPRASSAGGAGFSAGRSPDRGRHMSWGGTRSRVPLCLAASISQ
ncbi:hypothetical protein SLUN_27975 [Streptomyces lunaelactis]|uniref:Uncharacterized protein n=1 Tax=Streptomyces lunaelactis TaxID=1535768 RepID=A0A2R4T8S5_9ACTN|nr:hypothetical protein SLUN_27975 [Streptomyces lunaelactis]